MKSVLTYIALGSNLDNPLQQLHDAMAAMDAHPDMQLQAKGQIYRSKPLGPSDQPDFYNTVVAVSTTLVPEALLDALQQIEKQQNRVKTRHWGPRTIDLDIILYGDLAYQSDRLTIPHAQAHLRAFVLYPLYDIAGDLTIGHYGSVAQLRDKIDNPQLQVIDNEPTYND